MDLVTFVAENTYFDNNCNILQHQTIGIPMGTNAPPELANLTLYVDEAQFIDNLLLNQNEDLALLYKHTNCFIDDILTWDVEPPPITVCGLLYRHTY